MGTSGPLAFPQRPPGPALGALDDQKLEETEVKFMANPNLQYGSHDSGHGWTDIGLNGAEGYDFAPEGMYVYSDMPF